MTSTLRFWTQDTGIGLSESQQKSLFKAFMQADGSMTRRFGGTGLGLSICKHLVHLMGGDIQVSSEIGKGSTFSFELTLEHLQQPEVCFTPWQNKPSPLILMIDHNRKALSHYNSYFKALGLEVETASTVTEYLLKTKTLQPDLLVIDHAITSTSAPLLLQSLHQHIQQGLIKRKPDLLYMNHFTSDVEQYQDPHFRSISFIQKPFDVHTLKDKLRSILKDTKAELPKPQPTCPSQHAGTYHLLLVEDNAINQQVASELLRASGFKVDIADNGKYALDAISKKTYDAVLMDLQMPEMDGFTATQEIRKYYSADTLPIIAMTAHAMESDRTKSQQFGMNDYVTKPFILEQLLKTLSLWLPEKKASIKT